MTVKNSDTLICAELDRKKNPTNLQGLNRNTSITPIANQAKTRKEMVRDSTGTATRGFEGRVIATTAGNTVTSNKFIEKYCRTKTAHRTASLTMQQILLIRTIEIRGIILASTTEIILTVRTSKEIIHSVAMTSKPW